MRILLVENDRVTRGGEATALRRAGHSVTDVGTGKEALRLLEDETWDALILDLVLPGLSGFSLLVEADSFLPEKVVVTTGLAPAEVSGLPPGAVTLFKPYTMEQLLAAVGGP